MNEQIIDWMKNKSSCKYSFDAFVKKEHLKFDNEISIDLPKLYFKRAKSDIQFSGIIINSYKEQMNWAIITSYYSAYYGAQSLLSLKNYKSNSHIATICAIIYFYYENGLNEEDIIKLGKLGENNIESFQELKEIREKASYSIAEEFEEIQAKNCRGMAFDFLDSVELILRNTNIIK